MQKLDHHLRMSGVLMLLALALPFAAVSWSNCTNDFQYQGVLKWFWSSDTHSHCRALWHWSVPPMSSEHLPVFAWIWMSSVALALLSVLCLLSRQMPPTVQVTVIAAMPIAYLALRLPLDIISLSWPSGPSVFRRLCPRADANPFYAANVYSYPNVAAHYLVVLRVLLTAVAALMPAGSYLADRLRARGRLVPDAWKLHVGFLYLLSAIFPYAVTSHAFTWNCFFSNWGDISAAWWYKPPQWYLWAGSAFLLCAAALWCISWRAAQRSSWLPVGLVTGYILLRSYSDLVSLLSLGHGDLRNPGFFLPILIILCRLCFIGIAVFCPVLRQLRQRFPQFHVPFPDAALHAILAFSSTWIVMTWLLGNVRTVDGRAVGLSAGWGQPIAFGLFAVIPSLVMMPLIRVLSLWTGGNPDLLDVRGRLARYSSVALSTLVGPVTMSSMQWLC